MPTLPRRCLTTIFVFIVMITTGCTSSNNVRLTKSVGGDLAVEFKKNSTFTKWKVCEALRYHVLDFDEFGRIAFPDNELDCYPPSRSNRCPDEPLDNRLSCRLEDIQRNIENKEVFFISDGVPIIGSEAISTSGIPKRSRLYSLVESLSSSSLAASSSRQID